MWFAPCQTAHCPSPTPGWAGTRRRFARTSRAIALEEPGFADSFRLPDVPTETSLLTTAETHLLRLAVKPEDDDATQARSAPVNTA